MPVGGITLGPTPFLALGPTPFLAPRHAALAAPGVPVRGSVPLRFLVLLLFAASALSASAAAPRAARSREPGAVEILERAEEVRSPDIDYAGQFTLGVLDPHRPGVERKAAYTLIAHGKDCTLALMRSPPELYGAALLIAQGAYWFLLPRGARALQLSGPQVLTGDASVGDLARANLSGSYEPRLDGNDRLEGEPCWRLELTRTRPGASYPRVRLWVARNGFLPKKAEYYGMTGSLLRVARFMEFREGPIGLRPMKIEFEDATGAGGKTTMLFTDLRRIDASQISFTREGMERLREAAFGARLSNGEGVDLDRLLAALAAGKS